MCSHQQDRLLLFPLRLTTLRETPSRTVGTASEIGVEFTAQSENYQTSAAASWLPWRLASQGDRAHVLCCLEPLLPARCDGTLRLSRLLRQRLLAREPAATTTSDSRKPCLPVIRTQLHLGSCDLLHSNVANVANAAQNAAVMQSEKAVCSTCSIVSTSQRRLDAGVLDNT